LQKQDTYGYVRTLRNGTTWFYESMPYLDNAIKCDTVYLQAQQPAKEPVKQESKTSIEDIQSLVDASETVMKWLVKNVHQWNFSEYYWLNSATERVKKTLPPVEVSQP